MSCWHFPSDLSTEQQPLGSALCAWLRAEDQTGQEPRTARSYVLSWVRECIHVCVSTDGVKVHQDQETSVSRSNCKYEQEGRRNSGQPCQALAQSVLQGHPCTAALCLAR